MIDVHPDRWLGLVTLVGVLTGLLAWYVLPQVSERGRRIVKVLAAALFLVAAASTVAHAGTVGSRAVFPAGYFGSGDEGRRWFGVVLAIVGLVAGLAFSTMPDETATTDEDGEDDLPDIPAFNVPPWATPPVRALLAVTVALGAPAAGLGRGTTIIGGLYGQDTNGWTVAALILDAMMLGGAILFAALAIEDVAPRFVVGAFAFAAAGASLATAWPQTFGEEFWYMFFGGLAVGLLVPVAFRLLRTPFGEDRGSVVWGVGAAVLLVAFAAGAATRSSADSVGFVEYNGGDANLQQQVPAVPSFEVPTFEVPTP